MKSTQSASFGADEPDDLVPPVEKLADIEFVQARRGRERRPQALLGDDGRDALLDRLCRIETGPGLIASLGGAQVGFKQPFAAHEGQARYFHLGLGRRQFSALFAGVEAYQQLAGRHAAARLHAHFNDGAGHLRFDDYRTDGNHFPGHTGGGLPERFAGGEPLDGFNRFGEGSRKGHGAPDLAVLVPAEPECGREAKKNRDQPDTRSAALLFASQVHTPFATRRLNTRFFLLPSPSCCPRRRLRRAQETPPSWNFRSRGRQCRVQCSTTYSGQTSARTRDALTATGHPA